MSKENLEQFIQQISDSEELQTRIGDEIDTESLIALGVEHGCEFTAEDLAEHAELSDEELDGVAGGVLEMPIGVNFRRKSEGFTACEGQIFFKICDGTVFPKVKITNPDPSEVR